MLHWCIGNFRFLLHLPALGSKAGPDRAPEAVSGLAHLGGPAAPARPVLFAPLRGEALIPGAPHTPPDPGPAGFVSLAVWGRQRHRELERCRGVGGWAIQSLRPFSSGRLSSGRGGAQGQAAAVGVKGRAWRTDAGTQQGRDRWHSSQVATTPRLPAACLCVQPVLPRRTVRQAPGGPLGLQVEDVGVSVGMAAGGSRSPWGTFCWTETLGWEAASHVCVFLTLSSAPIPSTSVPAKAAPQAGWGLTGVSLRPGPIQRTSRGVCADPNRPPFVGTIGHSLRPHPLPKTLSCVPFLLRV